MYQSKVHRTERIAEYEICPKYLCKQTLPLKWLMPIADTLICYVYLFIYLCDMYTVHRFTLNCWHCRTNANYLQIGKTVFIFGKHYQNFCLFVRSFVSWFFKSPLCSKLLAIILYEDGVKVCFDRSAMCI